MLKHPTQLRKAGIVPLVDERKRFGWHNANSSLSTYRLVIKSSVLPPCLYCTDPATLLIATLMTDRVVAAATAGSLTDHLFLAAHDRRFNFSQIVVSWTETHMHCITAHFGPHVTVSISHATLTSNYLLRCNGNVAMYIFKIHCIFY